MIRQRTVTILATATVSVAIAFGAAAPASAHNFIVSSTPQEGETLTELPPLWQVTTNEDLLDLGGKQAGFALVARDAAGAFYGDGCLTLDGPSISAPAALGDAGAYTLVYQFVSADGHTLSGELPFVWQPPADAVAHVGIDALPVCGETASAPAPEPVVTAEPEAQASPEVTAEVIPISETPADDTVATVGIIAGVLGLLALIAVIITIVVRVRATSSGTGTTAPVAGDADASGPDAS